MRTLRDRRDQEPAFVLHTYPYRETSVIVEAFTQAYGRVALVARGAKRPRSEMRGLLNAFQPLLLSWAGASELKTLLSAEWRGGMPLPAGAALLCGFYLNEHPGQAEQAATLRRFELRLLAELGYAMPLTHEQDTGAPIDPAERYHYAFDRGARRHVAEPDVQWPVVRGETLLSLANERYPDAQIAAEAKRLMRSVLDHYLEQRRIFSRRVVRDLQALDEEGEPG